ncbi:hypothetical protein N9140_00995 [bacterium]|nr:hypothetical protein [bacterium]
MYDDSTPSTPHLDLRHSSISATVSPKEVVIIMSMDNTNNNEPIDFLIKDQNGEETMFKIKRTTKMGKVFTRIVKEGCR